MKPGWQAGCIDYAENMYTPTHEHTLYCKIMTDAIEEERNNVTSRTPDEMSALMIKLSRLNADDADAREAIEQAAHSWLGIVPEFHGRFTHIHRLTVPKDRQGEGFGSAIMDALCVIADERGWTLTLTPTVTQGITTSPRLIKFYQRFGFRLNRGRRKNFDTQSVMIRDGK